MMRDLIKLFAAGTILTAYALVVPSLAETGLGERPVRIASTF
ncbi:hypothetical protein U8607_03950 [Methylobacterium durans]|nr:hypothetical protein [Methylobacterium durans]MEA1831229.1 hypothetical protein [Methylobacterium durans]